MGTQTLASRTEDFVESQIKDCEGVGWTPLFLVRLRLGSLVIYFIGLIDQPTMLFVYFADAY